MFWNFVATVFAGLGAAGIAMGIRTLTMKRAPRWIIPVAGGLGMLAFLVFREYTWFDEKRAELAEGMLIVSQEEKQVPWRPWSYLVPQVMAFTVLDTKEIKPNQDNRDVLEFYLYRFEQSYTDTVNYQHHLLNCATQELVPLDDDNTPVMSGLRTLTDDDRLFIAACF